MGGKEGEREGMTLILILSWIVKFVIRE